MSGPRTSSILLLLTITILQTTLLQAKPLSAVHGRLRRDLRDSLPYEAQMMSYQPADLKGRGNELYYQPEAVRAQGLGQALQRLMENDQRREQDAAYLAGLLRLLNEAENDGQGKREEEEEEEDFQGQYPPDYDETAQTVSMAKPQALLDPQLAEAILNRYRQERLLQAGLNPASNRLSDREQERDQEVLRYLVEKILSSLAPGSQSSPSNRRAKRDISAVASVARSGSASLRRSRRSVDSTSVPSPNTETSLLRVKRLGDEDDEDGFAGQNNRLPHVGLQRMKRIDTDLPPLPKHSRKRRAVTYDPNLIAQHILQYLPA